METSIGDLHCLPARPRTRGELAEWVRSILGITVPDRPVCPHHHSPLDYLAASFLGGGSNPLPPRGRGLETSKGGESVDLLVWANRGGGKTMLAAAASLLEGIYKAPVAIRILGGSFDQSDRLAEYLRNFLTGPLAPMVAGRMTRQRIRLASGADIRMLSQSQRAVRGQHVQRIRCDEVDLFDPEIWRALQFVTRSNPAVRGGVEVFSTLHRPGGLMEQLVESASERPRPDEVSNPDASGLEPHLRSGRGFRLIQWCLWEVIQRCPPDRRCQDCPLEADCGGKARGANGFFSIDDAIAIHARSSRAAWEAEMLCKGAKRDWLVFGEFDPAVHVAEVNYCADFPTYRAIDFGYAAPFVCLWIQVTPAGAVHVIDEYVQARRSITEHAAEILHRESLPPLARRGAGAERGRVAATYVDPAGTAKEATSGAACAEMLAAAGIPCAWRRSTLAEGLELIRAALAEEGLQYRRAGIGSNPDASGLETSIGASAPNRDESVSSASAAGKSVLRISPRCRNLIEAMRTYHYPAPGRGLQSRNIAIGASSPGPAGRPRWGRPVKDGPDHLIDALRYFFVNRMRPRRGLNRQRY